MLAAAEKAATPAGYITLRDTLLRPLRQRHYAARCYATLEACCYVTLLMPSLRLSEAYLFTPLRLEYAIVTYWPPR